MPGRFRSTSFGSVTAAFFRPASSIVCEIVVDSSTGSRRSELDCLMFALNFGENGSALQLVVVKLVRAVAGLRCCRRRRRCTIVLDAAGGRVAEEPLAVDPTCPSSVRSTRRSSRCGRRRRRPWPISGGPSGTCRGRSRPGAATPALQDDLRQRGTQPGTGEGSRTNPKRAGSPVAGLDVVDLTVDGQRDREEAERLDDDVVADVADVAPRGAVVGLQLRLRYTSAWPGGCRSDRRAGGPSGP